jgi:hypothetical protein
VTETLDQRIARLGDEQSIGALALVLEQQGRRVDPFAFREAEGHLREALARPDLQEIATPQSDAQPGEIARTVLAHLAEKDDTRALVEHAITIPSRADRFDPATLAIGALVLFAFHAEIELSHDPGKGWRFRFKTKPLKDSTIAKALGQLIGFYGQAPIG